MLYQIYKPIYSGHNIFPKFEDQYSSTIVISDKMPFSSSIVVEKLCPLWVFQLILCNCLLSKIFCLASNVYLILTFDLLVNKFCDPTLIKFGVDVTMDPKMLTSFRLLIQINVHGRRFWLQTPLLTIQNKSNDYNSFYSSLRVTRVFVQITNSHQVSGNIILIKSQTLFQVLNVIQIV